MFARLHSFWRSLWKRHQQDHDLDDEIRFHMESRADDLARAGLPREEALRQARLEFGALDKSKEQCRESRRLNWLEDFAQDIRFALRMLRKSPGFTLTIVVMLALGVGANVAMLSVVDMLLFRLPAHVRQPETILRVDSVDKTGQQQMDLPNYPAFRQVSQNAKLMEVAAESHPYGQDYGRGSDARQIQGQFITHSFFDVLGTHLLMGRPFSSEEEMRTGGAPVAILSFDFWKQEFGADRTILGREIWIQGKPHNVIGVAPQGFTGLDQRVVDAWLPVSDASLGPGRDPLADKGTWWLQVIGRAVGGSTRAQAEAEAASVFRHSGGDPANTIRLEPFLANFREEVSTSKETRVSLWLSGVAFLVFLIACTNVANLFLVRALQRGQEMAVRLQLGATRGRLIRQFLAESLMVSLIGGSAALLLLYWARPLVRAFLLPRDFYDGGFLSLRVLDLAATFALLAGIVTGLWPAWRATCPNLTQALKSGGRALHERPTARSILLVAQVALTLLLSIGAALFVRSLHRVQAIELGFDASHVLVARMSSSGYQPAEINGAYERMRERALAVPGVENAALASMVPFYSYGLSTVRIPATTSSPQQELSAGYNSVTSDYFAATGMTILRGRPFLLSDRTGAPPVAIVNESLAKQMAPDGNAIGKCLRTYDGKTCMRIVGVVPDERRYFMFDDVEGQPKSSLYTPLFQVVGKSDSAPVATGLLIRTRGTPSQFERKMASALANVSPGSRLVDVQPMTEAIGLQTLPWRMGTNVFTLFGALALLLAGLGIYGLLAFIVRYRTPEIGVRLALGATPGNILALIFRQGMLLVVVGIAIGTAAAIGFARLMRSLLYGVAPTDITSYALATAVVVSVALVACYIPARRAMRVDPMVALRHE